MYFVIQILLPLRHWTFKDDVLWTEEGHRLSWRMMLRSKSGMATYEVVDKETGNRRRYPIDSLLSKKQSRSVRTKPDMIWQLCQRIKEAEAKNGRDVAVFVDARVRINGGSLNQLIDPTVDLANEPWKHFEHHDWILPQPKTYKKEGDEK